MTRPLSVAGSVVAAVIVLAAVGLRPGEPADPVADVTRQRSAVTTFHRLVIDGRWAEVHRLTAEPPAPDAGAFAAHMRAEAEARGRVTDVRTGEMRLRRSRTVPLLEVEETVVLSDGSAHETVSYFLWHDGAWLFGFSAPR